ncbi:unnamed protein product [Tilletia controversa]|nr:unnamed protein product [Tilletia controversa]
MKCITDKCPKSLAITESTIKSSCAQGGVPFTLSFSKDPDTESPTVPGPPANPPGKPTTGAKGTNNTLSSPDKSAAFQVALPNVFAAVCVGAAVVLYDFRI